MPFFSLPFAAFAVLAVLAVSSARSGDWRTADRSSAGLAPLPDADRRAVVQVYAARAVRWRGWFAVHSWVAIKEKDADTYEVMQVVGWRLWHGNSPVVVERGVPDRKWFGATPDLIADVRGEKAEAAIPKLRKALADYPYPKAYTIWPGPNSNTFVSYLLRSAPELGADLPPNAIGRDYLVRGRPFGRSESGTGVQVSLLGLAGATIGLKDGVEVQVLGLCFGVDFLRPALKLPIIGRLGFSTSAPYREPTRATGTAQAAPGLSG